MMSNEHEDLQRALRDFASERDWDQFHSPKNLAAALAVEAAEVLEHFQWLTEEGSRSLQATKKAEVAEELADVFIYLLRIADKLDVDLIEEARSKLLVNAQKYPAELARGNSRKYTEL